MKRLIKPISKNMFYVMVEISNFRQLVRLNESETTEIKDLLHNFGLNRGGCLIKDQNGYFLFRFHSNREKSLHSVSDFLFLIVESLQKKESSLFGYNLLLEELFDNDDLFVFNHLKSLLFLAPTENSVWAGSQIKPKLERFFPLQGKEDLSQIIGPVHKSVSEPLSFYELIPLCGWTESLKNSLEKQLANINHQGRIIRLRGENSIEKLLILQQALRSVLKTESDCIPIFPLIDSRDFLSQLLYQVDQNFLSEMPEYLTSKERLQWHHESQWELILRSQGGASYSGDSCSIDVVSALTFYYLALIRRFQSQKLPPVFAFLLSDHYESKSSSILQSIMADLIARENLVVFVLESPNQKKEFLDELSSTSWSFPPLYLSRILREIRKRKWESRFPVLDENLITTCQNQASHMAHALWTMQEKQIPPHFTIKTNVPWELLMTLDSSHHKILYAFLLGKSLMSEKNLINFFHFMGEDQAIIQDKLANLKALGFVIFDVCNLSLAWNLLEKLKTVLMQDGEDILSRLGDFLYDRWISEKRFSEVVFGLLKDAGKMPQAIKVLNYYISQKIDRNQNDFFHLLRPSLWETSLQEYREPLVQLAAAFKLRFALNYQDRSQKIPDLNRIKKHFTSKTELKMQGEWLLQLGRYHLYYNDCTIGFCLLKKALMIAQEEGDNLLEIRANIEIGKALLTKHRLEEGQEYFEIASRLSERNRSYYHYVVSGGWEAICCFLYGNLSQVIKSLEYLIPIAHCYGLQQWKIFFYFLKARINIEWGDPAQAVTLLDKAYELASRYGLPSITILLWKGRGLHGAGKEDQAIQLITSLSPGLERNLILAEIKVLTKEYQEALNLLEESLTMQEKTMPSGESLLWESGFSNIENKVLEKPNNKSVLRQQTEALRIYVKSKQDSLDCIETDFQKLLAEKSLLELNPFSHYVYLWYFLSLPNNKSEREALRLTLLGRALKDLQSRASRIDDYQLRQNFLFKPYWNKLLMTEARKHKLL